MDLHTLFHDPEDLDDSDLMFLRDKLRLQKSMPWLSAAFSGLFMGVHTDGFELTGGDLTRFTSSDWAERAFCAKCGSNIYYHAVEYGHPSVALGTLDDTSGLTRRFEFYTDLEPEGLGRTDETKTRRKEEKKMTAKGLLQLVMAGAGSPFLGDYEGVDEETGKFMFSLLLTYLCVHSKQAAWLLSHYHM